MIGYVSSLICAVITFGMALLQLSITFGAPFGEYVLGGQNKVLPKKMRFTSGTFFVYLPLSVWFICKEVIYYILGLILCL